MRQRAFDLAVELVERADLTVFVLPGWYLAILTLPVGRC